MGDALCDQMETVSKAKGFAGDGDGAVGVCAIDARTARAMQASHRSLLWDIDLKGPFALVIWKILTRPRVGWLG